MTDPTTDEIREVLEWAMSDSPEPLAWTDVERRATHRAEPPAKRRSYGLWLAVASCPALLSGGLFVLAGADDSTLGTDDGSTHRGASLTFSDSEVRSSAPASGATPPTPPADDEPVGTVGLPQQYERLGEIDSEGLRPLDTLRPRDGDVVIPTAPATWSLVPAVRIHPHDEHPGQTLVVVTRPSFRGRAMETLTVSVTPICDEGETDCGAGSNEYPNVPDLRDAIDIGGNAWESGRPGGTAAVFDDFSVRIGGSGSGEPSLEDPAVVEFIEGLRVGSLADLPEQVIAIDITTNTKIDRTTGEAP